MALSPDQVHVWSARLDLPPHSVHQLEQFLSEDEVRRAEQYRFDQHRHRFITRRGILRILLAAYLQTTPQSIRFDYSSYGKPRLRGKDSQSMRFNLAHSAGLALFALAYGREVGVDVEQVQADFDYLDLARRFFSATENAELHALPASDQPLAFFNAWTRKEAYLKACGKGLSLPLDQFDVSLAPGQPARLLAARRGLQSAERWRLQDLQPAAGYAAACCVEGQDWRLLCWQLADDWQMMA